MSTVAGNYVAVRVEDLLAALRHGLKAFFDEAALDKALEERIRTRQAKILGTMTNAEALELHNRCEESGLLSAEPIDDARPRPLPLPS